MNNSASSSDRVSPLTIINYSLPTIVVFLLAGLLWLSPISGYTWPQVPFHSAIEAFGVLAAIILAVLLLSSGKGFPQGWYRIRLSCALIAMGVLDGFHSSVGPGESFVWLHSIATMVGGILFATVWVPRLIQSKYAWPLLILILSIIFGVYSVVFPERMPTMLQEGRFSPAAEIINLIGGAGFLLAAIWFFRQHHNYPTTYYVLFANLCLLLGASAAIFHYSNLWDMQWWLWHASRLAAYLTVLYLIFKLYKESEKEKENLIKNLENAISEIKTLQGILPICSYCKQIRDEKGLWNQLEAYIDAHSAAEFTHGICPDCMKKHFGVVPDNNN